MARFVTIGYGDRDGYDRVSPDVRNAAHGHDDRLRNVRALAGLAESPVQVRNHEAAGVVTSEGPFMTSELPVAGSGVIEARRSRQRSSWSPEPRAPLPSA